MRPCNVPGNIIFLRLLFIYAIIFTVPQSYFSRYLPHFLNIFTGIVQEYSKVYIDYFQIKCFIVQNRRTKLFTSKYLNNALDHGSDIRQHDSKSMRSFSGLQFWSIVSAGAISRAEIEGISWRQFELWRRRLYIGDDSMEERLLCLLEELQDSWQDRIRASWLPIVL